MEALTTLFIAIVAVFTIIDIFFTTDDDINEKASGVADKNKNTSLDNQEQ